MIAVSLRAGHALTDRPSHGGRGARRTRSAPNSGWSTTSRRTESRCPMSCGSSRTGCRCSTRGFSSPPFSRSARPEATWPKMLDKLASVVRERFRVRRQVRALSAHGRITGWTLALSAAGAGGNSPALIAPAHIRLLIDDPFGPAADGRGDRSASQRGCWPYAASSTWNSSQAEERCRSLSLSRLLPSSRPSRWCRAPWFRWRWREMRPNASAFGT